MTIFSKKYIQLTSALRVVSGAISILCAQGAPASENTDWLHDAKYGVGIHWTSATLKKDGTQFSTYCEAVNNFDVAKLAQQLDDAGAGYLLFTMDHVNFWLPFPSAYTDSILRGKTCSRDLVSDLYDALSPKGIKLMLYLNWDTPADGAWRAAEHFSNAAAQAGVIEQLVDEIGTRYGNKLAGWWVDGFWANYGAERFLPYENFASHLRTGNANRLVALNVFGQEWPSGNLATDPKFAGATDYYAGEGNDLNHVPDYRYSGQNSTQWFTWISMDGNDWVHAQPNAFSGPRFTDDEVVNYIQRVSDKDGVFTYNAAPYQDALISDKTMAQLRAIKGAIRNNDVSVDDLALVTAPAQSYSGVWNVFNNSNYSTSAGSSGTFNFSGNVVFWYGVIGSDHGKADIYIDGVFDSTIDLYSETRQNQEIVYSKSGLTDANHSFKIIVRNDRNSRSSGNYVEVTGVGYNNSVTANDGGILFEGNWVAKAGRAYYQKTLHTSGNAGDSARMSFNGRSIGWYGEKGPDKGMADVYIDGAFDSTVDLYAPATGASALVYSKSKLASGTHSINIQVRGDKNYQSSGHSVNVDRMVYSRPILKIDDAEPAIRYVGAWGSYGPGYVGGTGHNAVAAGAAAEYAFEGTAVKWIGVQGPDHGKADVYIDGVLDETVDLYTPVRVLQASAYVKRGLPAGPHSIKIVTRGDKNVASSNTYVEVDAFETR